MSSDMSSNAGHVHAWGPIRSARYGSAVVRDCACGYVLAYEDFLDYPLPLDPDLFKPGAWAAQLVAFDEAIDEAIRAGWL